MERTVLITGGNRGIGLATAQAMADAGHQVAVTTRSEPVKDDRLLSLPCDVTDAAQVDAAFEAAESAFGRPIEIVVANAGITRDALLLRMTEDDFTSVLDTNLTGAFRVAKRAAKGMLRPRWGRIILIGSTAAMLGQPGQANYTASKAGLIGLGRSLARELAGRNITVNIVTPGLTETDMSDALSDSARANLVGQIPMGRLAGPQEIAAAVVFLASDQAAYITGAVLPVDGGAGMGH